MKQINYFLKIVLFIVVMAFFQQCANKFYKSGKDFYEAGNYKDAIAQYDQWIKEDPDNAKAYLSRAKAYQKLGEKQKAAEDYNRAGAFNDDESVFMKAARLYMEIDSYEKAAEMANKAIALDEKLQEAYKLRIQALITLERYADALFMSNKLISLDSKNAINHYWHGYIADKMGSYKIAEKDFRKAIEISPKYIEAYVALGDVLHKMEKYDQALEICNKALEIDKKNKALLTTRSEVYHDMMEFPRAINDLSKILLFHPKDEAIFLKRGKYYKEFNQDMNAINDFSKVISLNPKNAEAYYLRATAHEEVTNYNKAARDYETYLDLVDKKLLSEERRAKIKERLFELRREDEAPVVVFSDSLNFNGSELTVRGDKEKIRLKGQIQDESPISKAKANGSEINVISDEFEKNKEFYADVNIKGKSRIVVEVTDVYNNTGQLTVPLNRTEVDPPEVKLKTPYASYNGEVYLQNDNSKLYIEGQVKDENRIKNIYINDVNASFPDKVKNPNFSATIDIANKDEFKVVATDIYGNKREKVFSLNREGVYISEDNPMGKTWVVFIENSSYQTFASLDGPVKDVSKIKAALANYRIHNFIHKKNLTKQEMERFFSIELRDLVRANKVNSLLIWYAGHGKFINETGYWVPVDGKRDDEFSFFNINNLKASLQAYSDLITHTLVVTDACESGPSFYQAMRSITKKRDCGDWKDTKAKSAQVLSSAGYELAVDESQFTESFANTLVNNPNACLPIEDVVSKVTLSVAKSGRQEPQFGKIAGLNDEGGTFFFIAKEK
jgi:tetratricopeptide (TPR) repeat protein